MVGKVTLLRAIEQVQRVIKYFGLHDHLWHHCILHACLHGHLDSSATPIQSTDRFWLNRPSWPDLRSLGLISPPSPPSQHHQAISSSSSSSSSYTSDGKRINEDLPAGNRRHGGGGLGLPPPSQSSCTTALISLAPCLSYISGNSSAPTSSCCSQLATVVQTQAQCLCTVLGGGGGIAGITINQTQALTLPGACKVKTPPVSQCNAAAGGSKGSPSSSPQAAPSTPTTPSTTIPSVNPAPADSPSGSGSKSTNGDSSDGRMNKSAMPIFFSALIFGLSLASFF
ncbi:non-specific lipid transfer protein GPI-anchored 2-like [Phalaenopsis equestris]|uniref:non-specific lipid transfer protein GPI-anchored 2-like n=1 Tax=Phalaenopsis equestris TaxID=78828 RepID=UPI0009E1A110|nr:non-specific lipid transfer protein GPI-anchored 2-like [Phalaenopsis equestris]